MTADIDVVATFPCLDRLDVPPDGADNALARVLRQEEEEADGESETVGSRPAERTSAFNNRI